MFEYLAIRQVSLDAPQMLHRTMLYINAGGHCLPYYTVVLI